MVLLSWTAQDHCVPQALPVTLSSRHQVFVTPAISDLIHVLPQAYIEDVLVLRPMGLPASC